MNMIKVLVIIGVLFGVSCTDAMCGSIAALGDKAHIKCWSGGKLIYEGDSTGRIATTRGSDGWEFKDAKTGKFIRVSGQCVIEN